MSLEAQYRAVYDLFYKHWVRDAFLQAKFERFKGLTDAEHEEVWKAAGARLDFVAMLHAADIGANWYMPRFPASWTALQVALECDSRHLAARFTDTDEFELRVNDDSDGRALAAWVDRLASTKPRKPPNKPKSAPPLVHAPWLPDLLRYERLIDGHFPDEQNPRVERFEWDVGGIREALLERELFPVDEEPAHCAALLFRGPGGVNEAPLTGKQARVVSELLQGQTPEAKPGIVSECQQLLKQIQQG